MQKLEETFVVNTIVSFSFFPVKSTLLLHQSPTTGLFPTKTHGDNQKAKVHDNLYCAACSWALALAYRNIDERIDDDKGRTHELEHSAIKCMRGILYCYMRQADKVKYCSVDRKFCKGTEQQGIFETSWGSLCGYLPHLNVRLFTLWDFFILFFDAF
uniref:Phosphorylase b kinase regulatory subunit n=1 Tax=Pavo cristatus TaxID=9049 RepID=A0A8C9FQG7_PAVCR